MPASILPTLSKIFKGCLYNQIYKKVYSILLKYQTGYRKDYSLLNLLIVMFEKTFSIGFSYTDIHDSQDSKGRERLFL